jgi:hypothetical protein
MMPSLMARGVVFRKNFILRALDVSSLNHDNR